MATTGRIKAVLRLHCSLLAVQQSAGITGCHTLPVSFMLLETGQLRSTKCQDNAQRVRHNVQRVRHNYHSTAQGVGSCHTSQLSPFPSLLPL